MARSTCLKGGRMTAYRSASLLGVAGACLSLLQAVLLRAHGVIV